MTDTRKIEDLNLGDIVTKLFLDPASLTLAERELLQHHKFNPEMLTFPEKVTKPTPIFHLPTALLSDATIKNSGPQRFLPLYHIPGSYQEVIYDLETLIMMKSKSTFMEELTSPGVTAQRDELRDLTLLILMLDMINNESTFDPNSQELTFLTERKSPESENVSKREVLKLSTSRFPIFFSERKFDTREPSLLPQPILPERKRETCELSASPPPATLSTESKRALAASPPPVNLHINTEGLDDEFPKEVTHPSPFWKPAATAAIPVKRLDSRTKSFMKMLVDDRVNNIATSPRP